MAEPTATPTAEPVVTTPATDAVIPVAADPAQTGTVTPEQAGDPEPAQVDPATGTENAEPGQQDPRTYTKKINKLYYEREEQRRRADALEKEVEELRKGGTPEPATPTPQAASAPEAPKRPKLDEFEDYDHYLDALTDYSENVAKYQASVLLQSERSRWNQERENERKKTAEAEAVRPIEQKLDRGREKYEDFNEVIEMALYTEDTRKMVLESDYTDELAYYLGKNPEHAERIAQMGVLGAAKEIAKLEAGFAGTTKPPPQKKTSAAPEPIAPLAQGGSAPTDEELDYSLTGDAFQKAWERRELKRRGLTA